MIFNSNFQQMLLNHFRLSFLTSEKFGSKISFHYKIIARFLLRCLFWTTLYMNLYVVWQYYICIVLQFYLLSYCCVYIFTSEYFLCHPVLRRCIFHSQTNKPTYLLIRTCITVSDSQISIDHTLFPGTTPFIKYSTQWRT